MDPKKSALERAFELAESGKAASVNNIRRTLVSEGYSSDQLAGSALLAQLRKPAPVEFLGTWPLTECPSTWKPGSPCEVGLLFGNGLGGEPPARVAIGGFRS